MHKTISSYMICAALIVSCPARAETPAHEKKATVTDPTWTFEVGPGVILRPNFPGARHLKPFAGPDIKIRYKDIATLSTIGDSYVNFLNSDGVRAGPVFSFSPPRSTSDDREALTGLHEIPWTFRLGGFVEFDVSEAARLNLTVQHGLFGHGGLAAKGKLEFQQKIEFQKGLYLKHGPFIDVYDGAYTKDYFGITSTEAGLSSYAPFAPGVGAKAGVSLAALYPINDSWLPGVFIEASQLLGDAAQSPITKGPYGSATQWAVGFSITYRFQN
jgi:outer membrane protein